MLPHQLVSRSFRRYPPEAKALALRQIELLRQLPLGFMPLLLRELIDYDWKFPVERGNIERQFSYLASLSPARLTGAMERFSELQLPKSLAGTDWVNSPGVFSEQLSAQLWTTHQIDRFRAAAIEYMKESSAAIPESPPPTHRFGIVVIGQGVENNQYPLFRELRPHGVHFTQVQHADGMSLLAAAVSKRAAAHPEPYSHWYIDGGGCGATHEGVACVSYDALSTVRSALQRRMRKMFEAEVFDPEVFRTTMAQIQLDELGLDTAGDDVLDRFQLSLLTQGSGTQVFATTFVQWAAREALRRAQPVTLLARFSPRQRENTMDQLLRQAQRPPELDPEGSLLDADMGAYYTWLNQQRLSGASQSTFLVWFEDHHEALAVGPSIERNKSSAIPIELADLVGQLS